MWEALPKLSIVEPRRNAINLTIAVVVNHQLTADDNMEIQSAHPILQQGRFNKTKDRKYGRYDFERFDHLASSHANIGHGTFDKVNVNCRFLFKKSKWGVLGEHKNPAGIIYLDLTFDQPKDSQLHSATVIVTLEDENEDLENMKSKLAGNEATDYNCPVQITDCYGPKGFTGQQKIVQTKKSLHLTPRAEFSGFGLGGMGMDTESSVTRSSRWKFSGHLLPGKGNHWTYKSLKWDLSENDLESHSTHSNDVHTAFTFEHGGQPFFMRVEIKGKLKKLHGRLRDKMMKFPASSKSDENSVVTLINFGERSLFKIPLDEKARQVEFEMEMTNMNAIPMEVSDPRPASFFNVSNAYGLSNGQQQNSMANTQQQQLLQTSAQPQFLQVTPTVDATDPTTENLVQAFVNLHVPDQILQQEQQREAAAVQSTTLVIDETELDDSDEETAHESTVSQTGEVAEKLSEEQLLIQLLRMPGLLVLLRMIALFTGLLGFLSQTPPQSSASSDTASEAQHVKPKVRRNKKGDATPKRDLLIEATEQENLILEELRQTRAANDRNRLKETVPKRSTRVHMQI